MRPQHANFIQSMDIQKIKTVTVYGASSSKIDTRYLLAAYELGKLLAANNINCITGGGKTGMMGAVATGLLESGGKVTGIIPRFMVAEGWLNDDLSEVIITDNMHSRKQMMADKSDACIALPGGIGTFEELMEIITWRQLGLYNKTVVIMNINGYYDALLSLFQKAIDENFMHLKNSEIWNVVSSPEEALTALLNQNQTLFNMRKIAAM